MIRNSLTRQHQLLKDWYKAEENLEALENPDLRDILDLMDAATDAAEIQTVALAIGDAASTFLNEDASTQDANAKLKANLLAALQRDINRLDSDKQYNIKAYEIAFQLTLETFFP